MLEQAEKLVTNPVSLAAVHRLQRIYKALCCYGYDKYIGFDLSMLNGYNYYTGVIFRGYTYGTGDAVVKGGRYNNLWQRCTVYWFCIYRRRTDHGTVQTEYRGFG